VVPTLTPVWVDVLLSGLIHHQCQLLLRPSGTALHLAGALTAARALIHTSREALLWPVRCGEVWGDRGLPNSKDQLLLVAAPVSTPTAVAVMQPAGIPGSEPCPPSGAMQCQLLPPPSKCPPHAILLQAPAATRCRVATLAFQLQLH